MKDVKQGRVYCNYVECLKLCSIKCGVGDLPLVYENDEYFDTFQKLSASFFLVLEAKNYNKEFN